MCNKANCIWNGNGHQCRSSKIQEALKTGECRCNLGKLIEIKKEKSHG